MSMSMSLPSVAQPRFLAPLCALLLALAAAGSPAAGVKDAEFDQASQLLQRGSAGETSAVDAADESFTRLLAEEPTDPVLRACAGAAHALKATTTLLPWRKLAYAEDGLAQLDKALAQLTPAHDGVLRRGVPVSLETRFVAANTFLGLPSMFNRHARGAKLLDEVTRSPLLAQAPVGFRAAVWLRAAKAARTDERTADARQWLERVVQSGAPQAAAAQAQLKELP